MTQAALREILNAHPDLADTILQAFIARRQLLRSSARFTGLRVVGPHSSPHTFRVRDFLARNNCLVTWLDTDADPHVADLLRQFGLSDADTPVVLFGRLLALRNPSNRALADAIGLHFAVSNDLLMKEIGVMAAACLIARFIQRRNTQPSSASPA